MTSRFGRWLLVPALAACDSPIYPDADGDGVTADADCDDERADVRPGLPDYFGFLPCRYETPFRDGRDNDCDGRVDESFSHCDGDGGIDIDGDGYPGALDCDESDPNVHPNVPDPGACSGGADGRDNDCDTLVDEDACR
jgi:hypothetical protein